MEKITASEIIGELRKATRLYEVLKRAEDMVSVIVNLEQMERNLKINIDAATKSLAAIEKKEADTIKESLDRVLSAKEEASKLSKEAELSRSQANEVLRKARQESSDIINKAKEEVALIKASIETLRKEQMSEKILLAGMVSARDAMVSEMNAKRDQLLKAFS